MLRILDIQNELINMEQGMFQKICNLILCNQGYVPYKYTGSATGTNKTKKGTPDSVFIDQNEKYVYVEITTQKPPLDTKIKKDVEKCLEKISKSPVLNKKISKIVFLHNSPNIEETTTEKIKERCGKINFEIKGLEYLSNLLQNDCKDIAKSEMNIRDDINIVNDLGPEAIEKIANAVNNKKMPEFKENSIEEIKSKINTLYREAETLINNEDALIKISETNREKLKVIYDKLSIFDFYYNDKENEDSKVYYHNMLVILSKYNSSSSIDYYETIPNFAKNNIMTLHYYCLILIDNGNYQKANSILTNLYYQLNYEASFETMNRSYFLLENYDEVIRLLSNAKKEKFDPSGFLASMFIISKNFKKKYTESEIIRLNNSKFKKMPLVYFCTSKLLYDLDKRKKIYKEQFKKGIRLLNKNDVLAIYTMCNQAKELSLEEYAISYLESIPLTPLLQELLLELLMKKNELSHKEIEIINNIELNKIPENIDKNFLIAKVSENKGKNLEAISYYKKSYLNTDNQFAAYKYIQLSIVNKSQIDENLLPKIASNNNIMMLMIVADGFRYNGNYEEALKCLYKAIYLSKEEKKYEDVYSQFWYTITMFSNKTDIKEYVNSNCIVKLTNDTIDKTILLEDDIFFEEKDTIFDAIVTRTYSDLGTDILQSKQGSEITINNEKFKVEKIIDKYTYIAQNCFRYVEKNNYVQTIVSNDNDSEGVIEKIKQQIIEISNNSNHRMDVYEDNKNIPLSLLISKEKNFDEYVKIIGNLLFTKERILLTGERIDISLKKGFVIDVSSLIILAFFDLLEIIPKGLHKKIYITTSLKNKFQFYYKSLIRKNNQVETTISVDNNNELVKSETVIINQIKFWKKLNHFIEQINIVDVEAENDEIINKKTDDLLDKVQFDLMTLAKNNDIPFICDDIAIRRIANTYKVKHTNTLQILHQFSNSYEEYVKNLKEFAKCNYIYTLYYDDLSESMKYLYENYNDNSKEIFTDTIKSILDNKVSMDYYIPILKDKIDGIKKVQFIRIVDQVYEVLFATFIINTINNEIIKACSEHGISQDSFK